MTKLITTLVFIAFTIICTAQTHTESTTSSSMSYSINIDSDNDYTNNSSVSIKNSDDILRLKATFHKSKNLKIKEILLDRLGRNNLQIKKNTLIWKNNTKNEDFECELNEGRLFLIVDKHLVTNQFFEKISALVDDLKVIISGDDSKKRKKISQERDQRNLNRAKRDLDRAKENLKRAKENLERAKKN